MLKLNINAVIHFQAIQIRNRKCKSQRSELPTELYQIM